MKNNYNIADGYVIINLNNENRNDFVTFIDIKNLEKVQSYNVSWNASWRKHTKSYYATATEYLGMHNGKPKYRMLYLHRLVFDNPKSLIVDHISHDTLDNRESNLRITSNNKNNQNRKSKNSNNKSGYRNVTCVGGKYIVQLQVDGRNKVLGRFDDVDEAGAFAEEMRRKYYGEFAGKE